VVGGARDQVLKHELKAMELPILGLPGRTVEAILALVDKARLGGSVGFGGEGRAVSHWLYDGFP
jgi:hypothetical protein